MQVMIKGKVDKALMEAGRLIEAAKFATPGERLVQNAAAEAVTEILMEINQYPSEQGFSLEKVLHVLAMKAAHRAAHDSITEFEERLSKGKRR